MFAVFQNRENAVVRQVRRRAKHRFQEIVHSVEPIAIGAKPHVSVVVFKNRTDHVFGVGTRGILGRLPENAKPVVRAEPERSVPGKAEVVDPLQFASFLVTMQCSIFETEEACGSSGNDPAVRGFLKPKERDVRQMKSFVHTFEFLSMAPEESAIRAGPYVSAPVFEHRADKLVGKTFPRPEGLEAAALIVQQTAPIGRDPQGSIGRYGQAADIVIGHRGCVDPGVDDEP